MIIRTFSIPGSRIYSGLVLLTLSQIALYPLIFNRPCKCDCTNTESNIRPDQPTEIRDWEQSLDFTQFNNETGTPDGHYIVPNHIHFIKFKFATFNFIHMICILAAFEHQRPEKLYIHTDVERFSGKYWEVLLNTPGFIEVLVVERLEMPTEVFGQPLNPEWLSFHAGDVARLIVMRKYGGIYLDNDSYLVRSVDDLRRFEMTVAWRPGKAMMNQVVIAHKDARLLKEWQDGYKDYRSEMWYWNAGRQPAHVLEARPQLAHVEPRLLGTYDIRNLLYKQNWPHWRALYSAHLMVRWMANFHGVHYPNPIQEQDVLRYDNTLLEMVQDVYNVKGLQREV